jgi:hypothetical protein
MFGVHQRLDQIYCPWSPDQCQYGGDSPRHRIPVFKSEISIDSPLVNTRGKAVQQRDSSSSPGFCKVTQYQDNRNIQIVNCKYGLQDFSLLPIQQSHTMHQLPTLRAPNSIMPNPNPNMCSLFRATYNPKPSMQDPSLQSRSKISPSTNNVQILPDPTEIFRSGLPNQSYGGGKSSNEKAIWNPPRGSTRASRSGDNTTSIYGKSSHTTNTNSSHCSINSNSGPSRTYTDPTNNNTTLGPTNRRARGRGDGRDTTTEQCTYS